MSIFSEPEIQNYGDEPHVAFSKVDWGKNSINHWDYSEGISHFITLDNRLGLEIKDPKPRDGVIIFDMDAEEFVALIGRLQEELVKAYGFPDGYSVTVATDGRNDIWWWDKMRIGQRSKGFRNRASAALDAICHSIFGETEADSTLRNKEEECP